MGRKPRETQHEPAGFFALRSPLLPFDEVIDRADAGDESPDLLSRLPDLVRRPEVREAVFIASPHLESQLDDWLTAPTDGTDHDDLALPLARYVSRMATRPTPFGLFASHACGRIATGGEPSSLALPPLDQYRRHTRPDNSLLQSILYDATVDGLGPEQEIILNQSAYPMEKRLRFVESVIDDKPGRQGRLKHQLTSIGIDERLERALECLAGGPSTAGGLRKHLENELGLDGDFAEAYVDALADAQVIVPTAGVRITGTEPLEPLLEACDRSPGGADTASMLRSLEATMRRLDDGGLGGDPNLYRDAATALGPIGREQKAVEPSLLVQVDLAAPGEGLTLSAAAARQLERAAALSWRVGRPIPNTDLDRFRDEMRMRHEHEWVPLVEIVDPDVGVGFGGARAHEPLLTEFAFPSSEATGEWTKADRRLLRLLGRAMSAGAHKVELTNDDVHALGDPDRRLPETFAVWATIAADGMEEIDRGRGEIVLSGVAGPSGGELLGRFCHNDPELAERVVEHLAAEESLHPDWLYADVVHLPDARAANVALRPCLRRHELPYLGLSGAPLSQQIPVTDLEVAVRSERVVVRSRSRDQRVIPRLTCAHNHRRFGAPLYRLLCAIAEQDHNVVWSWGALDTSPFLPRVRHRDVVLSLARWRVERDELGVDPKRVDDATVASVRDRLGLPRFVHLVDYDNRLLLDLDDRLGRANFARVLRTREEFALEELYPGPDRLCVTREGRMLTHELIVPFVKRADDAAPSEETAWRAPEVALALEDPVEADPPVASTDALATSIVVPDSVPRDFVFASEWLYLKLYTGERVCDRLLGEVVAPFAAELRVAGAVDHWFFIRYADPDPHLRIRFHGRPTDLHQQVLPAVGALAARLHEAGRIERFQIDTYSREIDRYGGPAGIEPAEQIFWYDSEAVVDLLRVPEVRAASRRWKLTLYGLHRVLVDFGFGLDDCFTVARSCHRSFGLEFKADTAFDKQLGSHYRKERAGVEALFAREAADQAEEHAIGVFDRRQSGVAEPAHRLWQLDQAGLLTDSRIDLAASYLHMHANRMLASQARAQELVLYDHLERYYRSAIARRDKG